MNEAFNEKHLIKSYPASLKGKIEPQETEKLTPSPPSPTVFMVDSFWGSLGCPKGRWEQPCGGALVPLPQSSGVLHRRAVKQLPMFLRNTSLQLKPSINQRCHQEKFAKEEDAWFN